MRKIVQLEQYEYDKLAELAKLNESQIEKRAIEIWEEKGVAKINISIDAGTDYDDTFSINCKTYMLYKDDKFQIPSELRNRFAKIVKEEIMWNIEERFGVLIKAINHYKRKESSLNHAKYSLWGIAASGWAAFIAYICLS